MRKASFEKKEAFRNTQPGANKKERAEDSARS
jgi:hypothetical protein